MENETPRTSVPLTGEQATAVLKLHRDFLQAKVAKFEATEKETAAVNAFNSFLQSATKPDDGNWIVNLDTLSFDPK